LLRSFQFTRLNQHFPCSFLFHSNASPLALVLPLCFKAIRLNMRQQTKLDAVTANVLLDCMPSARFDMEKQVTRQTCAINGIFVLICLRRACWIGTLMQRAPIFPCAA